MKFNWESAGYVLRSKNRPQVLELLKLPQNPSQIAKKLKISLTHASKTIRELNSKKLIKCLNEESNLGRIYQITKEGEEILNYVKKVKII